MNNIRTLFKKNGSLVGLLIMMLLITAIDTSFFQVSNLSNILRQVSINGLIALGMTFVILTGGIDLSVGSVFALTSAVLAKLILSGVPGLLALLITLVLGILLGIINGVLIAKFKLQPFIATLEQ